MPVNNNDSCRVDTHTERSDGLVTILNKSREEYEHEGSFDKLENEIDFWRQGRGAGPVNDVSAIVYDDHEDPGAFSLGFREDHKSNFELQSLCQHPFYDSQNSKNKRQQNSSIIEDTTPFISKTLNDEKDNNREALSPSE